MPQHEAFLKVEPTLPEGPGVYRYYDALGKLMYVGKAKNLRKRVTSYFTGTHDSARLRVMVKKIATIDFTLVATEIDALILENNLIKNHQPQYNIRLKDDKSYPFIVVTNEPYPKIFKTRRKDHHNAKYYGPFTSTKTLDTLLEAAFKAFPIRNCALPLTEKSIAEGKYSACLEFQVGNCMAPCTGNQSYTAYNNAVKAIENIINGDIKDSVKELKVNMQLAAQDLQFELAHQYKIRLLTLEQYQTKSVIATEMEGEVEVITIAYKPESAAVNHMLLRNGSIVSSHNKTFKVPLDEDPTDLLITALYDVQQVIGKQASTVLSNIEPSESTMGIKWVVPKIGDKKKVVDLSFKNALYALNDYIAQQHLQQAKTENKLDKVLSRMQADLNLKEKPIHIECFDNSNFHGDNAVSACVVFKHTKPSKKDYRIFNVKTVVGANDFATMEEAVYRRYKRLVDEQQDLPQLLVIDGGKGQLNAACNALEKVGIYGKFAVLGIAKNLEELFFPNDEFPLYLEKQSITLKIIQQLRDEAHRFGLKNHRNRRSKQFLRNTLEDIEGVGKKTAMDLMKHFKSIENIQQQSTGTLAAIIGLKRAKAILAHFEQKKDD